MPKNIRSALQSETVYVVSHTLYGDLQVFSTAEGALEYATRKGYAAQHVHSRIIDDKVE